MLTTLLCRKAGAFPMQDEGAELSRRMFLFFVSWLGFLILGSNGAKYDVSFDGVRRLI